MNDVQWRGSGLTRSFYGNPVLRGINLHVGCGEVLGLVGENGAGKSTLMNLIGGVLAPDAGSMWISGRPYHPSSPAAARECGVALVHQELNLFGNLTVAENLFLDRLPRRRLRFLVDRRRLRRQAQQHLGLLQLAIDPDTPLASLAPGQRQLVEIAAALATNSRLIVFDEPTTSLSDDQIERLHGIIGRLRSDGLSVIYISHDLGHVLRLCDRIAVLRDGELQAEGPAGEFTAASLVEKMIGRRIEAVFPKRHAAIRGTQKRLEVLGVRRTGSAHAVHFDVHAGEIVGLAGLMGAGRTELVRTLFGLDSTDQGEARLNGRRLRMGPARRVRQGLAMLTEDRRSEGILGAAPVVENLTLSSLNHYRVGPGPLFSARRATAAASSIGDRLRISCSGLRRQPVRTLSGGNQQKVVIGKWLLTQPQVLMLDEPTRGVDVSTKSQIYSLIAELADGGAGILVASSELEELTGLCDRILVMYRNRIVAEFQREEFDRQRILMAAFGHEVPR